MAGTHPLCHIGAFYEPMNAPLESGQRGYLRCVHVRWKGAEVRRPYAGSRCRICFFCLIAGPGRSLDPMGIHRLSCNGVGGFLHGLPGPQGMTPVQRMLRATHSHIPWKISGHPPLPDRSHRYTYHRRKEEERCLRLLEDTIRLSVMPLS